MNKTYYLPDKKIIQITILKDHERLYNKMFTFQRITFFCTSQVKINLINWLITNLFNYSRNFQEKKK